MLELINSTPWQSSKRYVTIRAMEAKQPAIDNPRSALKPMNALTGLRFITAAVMVYVHSRTHFSCLQIAGVEDSIFTPVVTFFFMLSGFVLTYNYAHLTGAKEIWRFYRVRISRIWPSHVASLALLIFLVPQVFKITRESLPLLFTNAFMLHAWIPNWKTFFSFNGPSWTNSTEMFFYLCFPFLLIGMRKKWWIPLVVSGFLAACTITLCNLMKLPEYDYTQLSAQGLLYVHPITRLLEFSCGMVLAALFAPKLRATETGITRATILELAAVAFVCWIGLSGPELRHAAQSWAGTATGFWLHNNLFAIVPCGLLILVLAHERGLISKLLRTKPLVWLGEISFAIYMLHAVVLAYRGVYFSQADSVLSCICYLGTLIVGAHLMTEIVEKPARKLITGKYKFDFAWKPAMRLSAEVAALAGLIYLGMPQLETLSKEKAIQIASGASISKAALTPKMMLSSGTINTSSGSADIRLVWEALESHSIDSFLIVQAADNAGNSLGSTTLASAPRHEYVKAGTYWSNNVSIRVADAKQVATVTIRLGQSARKSRREPTPTLTMAAHTY